MTPTNRTESKRTTNPLAAMAAFPLMMANPLCAMYAGMSGVAYTLDLIHSFNSLFLPKRKEHPSVQPESETAKSGERSKLRLITPTVSKVISKNARPIARLKPATSRKRVSHKAKGVAQSLRKR